MTLSVTIQAPPGWRWGIVATFDSIDDTDGELAACTAIMTDLFGDDDGRWAVVETTYEIGESPLSRPLRIICLNGDEDTVAARLALSDFFIRVVRLDG